MAYRCVVVWYLRSLPFCAPRAWRLVLATVRERTSTVERVRSGGPWERSATPRYASRPAATPPRGPRERSATPHTWFGMGTQWDCCSKTPPRRVAKERPVQQLFQQPPSRGTARTNGQRPRALVCHTTSSSRRRPFGGQRHCSPRAWERPDAPRTWFGMGTRWDCCSQTPPRRVAKEQPVQQHFQQLPSRGTARTIGQRPRALVCHTSSSRRRPFGGQRHCSPRAWRLVLATVRERASMVERVSTSGRGERPVSPRYASPLAAMPPRGPRERPATTRSEERRVGKECRL